MNICIVGTGYVGLTTAAILADLNHDVTSVDIDEEKINRLQKGHVTIYEPDLENFLHRNKERLTFTTELKTAVEKADAIFLTVGTPSKADGESDLSYLFTALNQIASSISSTKTIIIKSTVPPGTNEQCVQYLVDQGLPLHLFTIVSNPEFLREGSAVFDSRFPDRIVVGVQDGDEKAIQTMKKIYKGIDAPWMITSLTGSEMIKYASNALLATKISFINELARVCDAYSVNVTDVSKGIGLDKRIGPHFLQAGLGYGGSCFPKDLQALQFSSAQKGIQLSILKAVENVNATQTEYAINKLEQLLPKESRIIAVLGVAFKPNTDDIRYSPAVSIIQALDEKGYTVTAYDPEAALPDTLKHIPQPKDPYEAIEGADAVVLATDWDVHKQLDWQKVKKKMKGHIVFDGRNCLQPEEVRRSGLTYIGVGRS